MTKKHNTKPTQPQRRKKGSGTIISRHGHLSIRWREDGKIRQEAVDLTDTKKNREEAAKILEEKTGLAKLLSRQQRLALLIKEQEDVATKIARLKAVASGHATLALKGIVDAFRKSKYRQDCPPAQLDRYCVRIAAFVEWAGADTAVADVDDAMAAQYADVLASKYAGATYNKHLRSLQLCWAALSKSAGVDVDPWAELARKRNESHTRRALSNDEIDKLLATVQGELRDLILIGLHTGLRLRDAARLRWENFADGFMSLKTAKTGALVSIPASRLLTALRRSGTSGYVCPVIAEKVARSHGGEMLSKEIVGVFRDAGIETEVKEAGWSRARNVAGFHALRHTFVSKCIEAGIPAALVKELVGHTTETMTAHYAHPHAEAIEAAFNKAGL